MEGTTSNHLRVFKIIRISSQIKTQRHAQNKKGRFLKRITQLLCQGLYWKETRFTAFSSLFVSWGKKKL